MKSPAQEALDRYKEKVYKVAKRVYDEANASGREWCYDGFKEVLEELELKPPTLQEPPRGSIIILQSFSIAISRSYSGPWYTTGETIMCGGTILKPGVGYPWEQVVTNLGSHPWVLIEREDIGVGTNFKYIKTEERLSAQK